MWLDLEHNVRYVTYVQRRHNLVPHSRRTPASLQPHSRQRWTSDVLPTACRWWSDYIRMTSAPIRPEGQKARGPHVPGECGPLPVTPASRARRTYIAVWDVVSTLVIDFLGFLTFGYILMFIFLLEQNWSAVSKRHSD